MSRFLTFLKEELGIGAEPSFGDTANFGNVDTAKPQPVLTKVPDDEVDNEEEKMTLDDILSEYEIDIPKDQAETIIAIIDKTLDDWNREKNYEGKDIEKLVSYAIENNLIDIKSY